uniref:Gustatory receptor n=1 Tax=Anopheles albimanus TaxID=7167 RepID=A0A182G0C0_ANOAL
MESARIDDFHQSVRPFLLLSQLFSLFPLDGLFRPGTIQDISFRWLSFRTAYSFYFFISGLGTLVLHIYYSVAVDEMGMVEISSIIYYSLNLMGGLTFFYIAYRWKSIMGTFRALEGTFLRYPYVESSFWTLRRETLFIGITMLALAFVEDALHVVAVYHTHMQFYERCDNSTPFWKRFYETEHSKYFHYIPYSVPAVVLIEITHKIFLFIWTFMDLFIIFVALALARRYNQFYRATLRYKGRHVVDTVWQQLRLDYGSIASLVAYMEGIMSPIILLSAASDLFFIFYQMFNSFQFTASPLSEAYFKFSLGFLIFRTLVMLLMASNVHVASLKALDVLRSVPMSCWSIDVQRLSHEVLNGAHYLTGHGFFFLNRGIILAMAGTLITYELVMLKEAKDQSAVEDFCAGDKRLY